MWQAGALDIPLILQLYCMYGVMVLSRSHLTSAKVTRIVTAVACYKNNHSAQIHSTYSLNSALI